MEALLYKQQYQQYNDAASSNILISQSNDEPNFSKISTRLDKINFSDKSAISFLDKYSNGYFPYIEEAVHDNILGGAIRNCLDGAFNINGDNDKQYTLIGSAVLSKLSGMRYKYPLVWPYWKDEKMLGTSKTQLTPSRQDYVFNSLLYENRDYLIILKDLWQDREEEYNDYLHITNTSKSTTQADQTGESHTGVNSKGHSEGTNEGESHTGVNSKGHSEGTTEGESHTDVNSKANGSTTNNGTSETDGTNHSEGKTHSETDGTTHAKGTTVVKDTSNTDGTTHSETDGTDKGITVNAAFPESNVSLGHVTPGAVSYNFADTSSEDSKISNSRTDGTSHSESTSTNDTDSTTDGTTDSTTDGTSDTDGTSHSEGKTKQEGTSEETGSSQTDGTTKGNTTGDTTGSSQTDGTTKGNTTGDTTGSSQTDGTTKGNQNSEASNSGRSVDLITLSEKFQAVIEAKTTLVDAIVRILRPSLSFYVNSFSSDYLLGLADEDIFNTENI